MKILWLDTETTGVDKECDLFQIAGIIEIDGVVKEEFDITSKPFADTKISKEALMITGKTLDEIMSYQEPILAKQQFTNILSKYVDKFDKNDKFILAGHNIQYDFDKTLQWFNKTGDKYFGSWFSYKQTFCTLSTIKAFQVAGVFQITENSKLITIAEKLRIPLDFAHNALFDIHATREIGNRLLSAIKKLKK